MRWRRFVGCGRSCSSPAFFQSRSTQYFDIRQTVGAVWPKYAREMLTRLKRGCVTKSDLIPRGNQSVNMAARRPSSAAVCGWDSLCLAKRRGRVRASSRSAFPPATRLRERHVSSGSRGGGGRERTALQTKSEGVRARTKGFHGRSGSYFEEQKICRVASWPGDNQLFFGRRAEIKRRPLWQNVRNTIVIESDT